MTRDPRSLDMPSPFPGVDPYLEASGLWESFHGMLVATWTGSLNRELPEHYVAQFQSRIQLVSFDEPASQRLPDILVRTTDVPASPAQEFSAAGVATIEPTTIPLASNPGHAAGVRSD
jgi:hypothetical protein